MNESLRQVFRAGCLISVLAPIIAIVLYPRGRWLLAFPLLGVVLLVVRMLMRKDLAPTEVADWAERLLDGNSRDWDIDDYEHLYPRNQQLKDMWLKTMSVGGLPEEWVRLDDAKKTALREVIAEMRRLEPKTS